MEIPEPPEGRKKPIDLPGVSDLSNAPNQPGEPIQLGRALDPELVPEAAQAKVEQQQEQAPDALAVPSGVVVPPAPPSEREAKRR